MRHDGPGLKTWLWILASHRDRGGGQVLMIRLRL